MTDVSQANGSPAALSPAQFVARYGVCRTSVWAAIKSGNLRAKKYGRRVMIPADAAEAWFAALPDAA